MTLNNIKTIKKDRGFTLVELLIVIVVIAILAAITIVAYNGVQNRAKNSAAQSAAITVQKKLEAYNASVGNYPSTAATTDMAAVQEASLSGTGITLGTPTASTGQKTVQVKLCTVPAGATGYQITYWDYTTGTLPATQQISGGTNATACTTYTAAT
jgi:prepilin-type N-terminal cleavage/methylation domain-containing protein